MFVEPNRLWPVCEKIQNLLISLDWMMLLNAELNVVRVGEGGV